MWKEYPIAVTAYTYLFGSIFMSIANLYFVFTGQAHVFILPRQVREKKSSELEIAVDHFSEMTNQISFCLGIKYIDRELAMETQMTNQSSESCCRPLP